MIFILKHPNQRKAELKARIAELEAALTDILNVRDHNSDASYTHMRSIALEALRARPAP